MNCLKRYSILVLVFTALFAAGCSNNKEVARSAMARVDQAFAAALASSTQASVPEADEVQQKVRSLHEAFDAGRYSSVIEQAPGATKATQALGEVITARNAADVAAQKERWSTLATEVPARLDTIDRRLQELRSAKRLPGGMKRADLETAAQSLAAMQQTWSAAVEQHDHGNVSQALTQAAPLEADLAKLLATVSTPGPQKSAS